MSHEIVYGRQFIKVPMGPVVRYIPLSLHGSNNCTQYNYQTGREVRARYWSAMYFNGAGSIPVLTEQEILEYIKTSGSEYDQNFKRGGKWVDNEALYRYFQNGIEQAKTLEEIFTTNKSGVRSLRLDIRHSHNKKTDRSISSTQELIQTIQELQASGESTAYFTFSFGISTPIQFRTDENTKISVILDNAAEYFVLEFDIVRYGYVKDVTSRRLGNTQNKANAKRFKSEAEALRWANKYLPKFNVTAKVVKVLNT